jgi:hypothetical protein
MQHARQKDVALVVHTKGGEEGERRVPPHLKEEKEGGREGGVRLWEGGREGGRKGGTYRVVAGVDVDTLGLPVAALSVLPLWVSAGEREEGRERRGEER